MTGTTPGDELFEQMRAYEHVSQFNTQCLLKENEFERTELVSDANGMCYIRKYLEVDEGRIHPYERLVGVDAPFIPRVVSTSRVADKLVVVCEYVAGTSLEQLVKEQGPVSGDLARTFMSCIADALSFLHAFGGVPIIHRDVNPSNIIVNTQGAWLIDLGIARTYDKEAQRDTHLWGTAGYAAPEQFGFGQTDARSDVYALGKVLLFMLTGNPDAQLEELSSLHARRVVKVATALDPRQRYANAANMKDALLEQCQANTAASHAGTLDTIWNIWRIAATAVAAVLLIAFVAVGVGTGVPALAIAYMGVYLFCVGIPWLALTDAFGILGRLGWFDGKRWATAVVLIMLSIAVLFVFVGIWMAVGLPWPSSTAGS